MRVCKNCQPVQLTTSKQKSKFKKSHQNLFQIEEQYGLGKIISNAEIITNKDEYMLQILSKTLKKTQKLEGQMKKMRKEMKSMQKDLDHMRHHHKSLKKQLKEYEWRQRDDYTYENGSIRSNKLLQIGQITRATQRQSRSLSKNSLHSFTSPILPPYKDIETHKKLAKQRFYSAKSITDKKPNPFQTYNSSKFTPSLYTPEIQINKREKDNSAHEGSIQGYLPSYEQMDESLSSNLLSNDDSAQINNQEERERMQREFEELIILEKTASQQQKPLIKSQIKAFSKIFSKKAH